MKLIILFLTVISLTGCLQENITISIDGKQRVYDLYIPDTIKNQSVPLVVDLHGLTSNSWQQRLLSGYQQLADEEGFAIMYPQGTTLFPADTTVVNNDPLLAGWNAGGCCASPADRDEADVEFILAAIEQVSKLPSINIDEKRVYLTGHSNGSAMAQRVATEASEKIAAVAGYSLYLLSPHQNTRAVPVINFHGTDDTTVSYFAYAGSSAQANFTGWAVANNCIDAEPTVSFLNNNSYCETYSQCDNDAETTLCSITGGRHVLYTDNRNELDMARLGWNFLQRFSLD